MRPAVAAGARGFTRAPVAPRIGRVNPGPTDSRTPASPTPSAASLSPLAKFSWIGVLYVGSGLPFGIFNELVPIWLRQAGVGLAAIGSLKALAVAWSAKVLWSPAVDRFGGRRTWIAASLFGCALAMALAGFIEPSRFGLVALVLGLLAISSATQDIAVDAYTIGVIERGQEGPANSVRVVAYRVAMWLAGGLAVALAAFAPWSVVLWGLAALFVGLGLVASFAPRLPRRRGDTLAELFSGLLVWFGKPGAVPLAALVLLYKTPDAALGMMVRTFWVDAGIPIAEIGVVLSPVTLLATIGGAAAGGLFVARTGILHGLLWLGLAQSLSNLAYSVVDWTGRPRSGVLVAAGIESFCGGLATAALLALLMRVCEKERAATEYALLSALFAATRELTGMASGLGVEILGYGGWFAATAFLALPGIALLFTRSLASRVGEPVPFSSLRSRGA